MLLNKLEDDCNIGSTLHETRIILSIKSSEEKIKKQERNKPTFLKTSLRISNNIVLNQIQ